MSIKTILRVLSGLLIFLAGTLLLPIPFSLFYEDEVWPVFLISSGITFLFGGLLALFFRKQAPLSHRESFAIVTLAWVFFSILGAMPYLLTDTTANVTDAIFESMSGFTTTGSTVLTYLSELPESILFWRSLTQWLGGMGIIVISLIFLPSSGIINVHLFEAEVPGPTKGRLGPRIRDTAKTLWQIYLLLTVVLMILLMAGGLTFFDSVCHALTIMATGGFSTYDSSIMTFSSSYIHWVIIIFMFLAGTNFFLHYQALVGKDLNYFKSEEFCYYFFFFLIVIIILTYLNLDSYSDFMTSFRDSAFQVVSIGTSTGLVSTDYDTWPLFNRFILIFLMIVGSCAGSTGGGIKIVRIVIVFKHALYQIFHIIHPKAVISLKFDKRSISMDISQKIIGLFILYLFIFSIASLIMTFLGMDIISATSSVISCLSNIGPGLESVGPTQNYAHVPEVGKIVLTICMLVGRLEIFTVLVLFSPSFWKN